MTSGAHDPGVTWTRGAVVLGLLLLLAGFAVGVAPRTVDAGGQQVRCGTVLLAAAPAASSADDSARAGRDDRCADATALARKVTWGLVAAGVLVALVGWTALRENAGTTPRPAPAA